MDRTEIERVAASLTDAQRRYIEAVANAGVPYEPRHGVTANWALRHGVTATIIRLNGKTGEWDSFPPDERFNANIKIMGQQLTDLGHAVRNHLTQEPQA